MATRVKSLNQAPATAYRPFATSLLLGGGLIALAALVLASLAIGAHPIPLATVIDALMGQDAGADGVIVRQARLARTLAGLGAGAALGLSGALVQGISRNLLAEPGLLGVNAGAGLAVALAIMLAGASGPVALFTAGSIGAFAAAILVFAVGSAGGGRGDAGHFILAGMALGAVMSGLSSALALLDPGTFDAMRYWMAGTLDIRNPALALAVLPVLAVGSVAALLLARPLNALALGHDVAASLGARPVMVQGAGLALVALLCGTATAVTGPISFVGLMVPHVARRIVGADMRAILAFCLIFAPILLLAADIVGRIVVAGELRVSIVTAFLGAPVLIAMARRL